MAAVTLGIGLANSVNGSTYASGSFSPASGDLLVVKVMVAQTAATGSVTDSLGGSWDLIETADGSTAGVRKMWCFVRTALSDGSALTVTMDVTGDAGTGAVAYVERVSGMSRTGTAAVRQKASLSNQPAANTPALTFPAACLTGNPTIVFLANSTNPAGVTEPTGWTEHGDNGFTSPTGGAEIAARNSGFTGTTITWGSASASDWGAIAIELDTTSAGGTTAAPGTGLLAATGFAPTIQTPVTVTAALGVLTATGFSPTVQVAVTVSPGVGSAVVTGFAPTVETPVNLTPGVGTAILSGFAPGVLTPVAVFADVGSAVLAGFAPSVGSPANAVTQTGTLTLTGLAPAVVSPVSVTAGLGEMVATGFAPTFVGTMPAVLHMDLSVTPMLALRLATSPHLALNLNVEPWES